jgi:hypothetical protein
VTITAAGRLAMSERLERPAPGWPIACEEQAEAPHCG